MGGGDLNMKKSWHPLLLKNQEQVWLKEKQALEEKKKLDQLRKEKEEERQLQELQRLQEEQTGKKRTERLDWMYTTPATGSTQNPNDLEDYLLGKKRVDKMLTADDNAKIGASHKNFIASQNANNIRDIAAKVREDPLLAIKRQEQESYKALMSNPLRLRAMQERNGIKPKKDKKRSKEERRKEKEEPHGTQSEVLDVNALAAAHRTAETVALDLQGGISNPILGPTNPTILNSIVTEIEVLDNVAKAVLDISNARAALVPLLAGVAVVLMESEPV
ncbi:RNA-splicing factor [Pleurotus ostreatus]|uniref:CBF1-interacting co-repressor CIR N-terminal domain-containing protein n=1 Tax=Pleurotus ostreatus (strain PC15) TaxID=1137138 RepID=A0A067NVI2_PLEO1|nr:RNA-splicing factor [Pleurotus ostreatus]KDQ31015.1 hypothetical protein PLEOSDRAFT_1096151 [Pleurotus ostreatus PC15]